MKANPIVVARIIGRFLPVVRKIADALARDSVGGKRITPEERDGILSDLIAIVEEELAVVPI